MYCYQISAVINFKDFPKSPSVYLCVQNKPFLLQQKGVLLFSRDFAREKSIFFQYLFFINGIIVRRFGPNHLHSLVTYCCIHSFVTYCYIHLLHTVTFIVTYCYMHSFVSFCYIHSFVTYSQIFILGSS